MHDSHDPGEVLEWMAAELQRAEDDGVYAYIISHIPSGHDDCGYTWSHEYNRVIKRLTTSEINERDIYISLMFNYYGF